MIDEHQLLCLTANMDTDVSSHGLSLRPVCPSLIVLNDLKGSQTFKVAVMQNFQNQQIPNTGFQAL